LARARTGAPGPDGGRRNHFVLITLVLAVVGVLAAVGSGLEDIGAPPSGSPAASRTAAREGGTLTIAWSTAPTSLDPAFAVDPTSARLVSNLMDPLVRLDDELQPVPSLAKGWEVSPDARRVRFFLRQDGRWTDGTPVTAEDFEFAWKRALSPELDSPQATRLLGIAGAAEYNACPARCDALAARVRVRALGDWELVVHLESPQPWFPAATAHPAFLPVPAGVVGRLGSAWAEPDQLVTNGPFTLADLQEDSVVLVKNAAFRRGQRVSVGRVVGRMVGDAAARVQTFDAGSVLALDGAGLPGSDLPALVERREFELYPALGAKAYAFNLRTLLDVHQRRAMSLAVDRAELAENLASGDLVPATRLTPRGLPDFARPTPDSPWFPPGGDLERARAELAEAAVVKRRLTLLHVDAPGNRDIAVALRAAWQQLGIETAIRAQPPDAYLDFSGPLSPNSVDLYQFDVDYPFPEAVAGLSLWTCDAERNKTNFCHAGFDGLVEAASRELDADGRDALAMRAEALLFGEEGRVPGTVLFWPAYPNLESLNVAESFRIDPLGQIPLYGVTLRDDS
jgi:oligopeptide transport system substrate-binding protein